MLIVLNCVATLPIRTISERIRHTLTPTIQLNDAYRLSFDADVFSIIDAEGNIVHQPVSALVPEPADLLSNKTDEVSDEEAQELTLRAMSLYGDYILSTAEETRYHDRFVDIFVDTGIVTKPQFFAYPVFNDGIVYNDIITSYRNSTRDLQVITSCFGQRTIDKLYEDLGNENVTVINITRNPSVVFALAVRSEAWYREHPSTSRDQDLNIATRTILATAHTSLTDDLTIKFEDILVNGGFEVAGKFIDTSNYITNYNGLITQQEHAAMMAWDCDIGESELDALNVGFSSYVDYLFATHPETAEALVEVNAAQKTKHTQQSLKTKLPDDVFGILGYAPLSKGDILAP